jgi:predicted  nucleic acid-binding Zn-ribbon protein
MSETEQRVSYAQLEVKNIGGIEESTVEFSQGVTILVGRNATNRTSLLQAIMAGVGSNKITLNSEASRGSVELTVDGKSYKRTFRRENDSIITNGDVYLEDPTLVDLFGFLLERNEARQAVAQGDDLRDLIMRPVDTAEIKSRISQLQTDKDQIKSKISDIEQSKGRLPELEREATQIRDNLSSRRGELAEIKKKIESHDEDIESKNEQKEKLENKLGKLSDVRNKLERTRQNLETQRSSIDALREERESLKTALEEHQSIPAGRLEQINDELQRLRSDQATLEDAIDQLQTVIQFNQDVLQDGSDVFAELYEDDETDEEVTNHLLNAGGDDDLICWTCGTDITADQVEDMVERLQEVHKVKMSDRSDLQEEISDLQTERSQLKKQQRRQEDQRSQLADIGTELEERRDRISDLENRRDDLRDTVEGLESEVEKLRSDDDQSELVQLHKEANKLELAIERLEDDLEDITDEITQIEDQLGNRDSLEAQREELTTEIKQLRTRIERLEKNAIDQFNTHMETILDLLEYDNLTRVWLERTETKQTRGPGGETAAGFDLHVVRETNEGTVYEDTVQHLSESEREVVGLVFALAGYLVHDLHEKCPFLLLDSIEAIDSQRIETLIEYFAEYPEYLIVALLDEDARHLSKEYQRITDI